jgi:cytidyltransferase-like protein
MKTVITFGAFDIVHDWHRYYLQEAKKYWDRLITIVAKDITIKKVKWKNPLNNENKRVLDVKNLWIADIVELWHETDMMYAIKKHQPDVVAIWYDQNSFIYDLSEYLTINKIKTSVITIDGYKVDIYKSSKFRNL